ncbi:MAG: GH3 auxin-responsive promoter family protein [Flavobacteriales bacterium]
MGLKRSLSKPYADFLIGRVKARYQDPVRVQRKVFEDLIRKGKGTAFGKDHGLEKVRDHTEFCKRVPIRDYEGLRPYIDRVVGGEKDVLWPGLPLYLSKTSGTTSGAKYIPLTRDSMPNHIGSTKRALLSYIHEKRDASFLDGKMIFLQGSPELEEKNGIKTGRLSGIVAHHVPSYLQKNRLPSWETNMIQDWEAKLERVIDETLEERMTLIGGIPSWVQMYFERIRERTGYKVKEVFPHLQLYVHGGVNFEPYRTHFQELLGGPCEAIETYPASEGFIAYQDRQDTEGMLLTLDSGIFYEFVPLEDVGKEEPLRLTVGEVEAGKDYAVVLSNNAGLWAYDLGDTVRFTHLDPPRIEVSGRTEHFTSAFGEHVIAKEVEEALRVALREAGGQVVEFTVAPRLDVPGSERPHHEWFIEFAQEPADPELFWRALDERLQEQNIYYRDLIQGGILRPLQIRRVQKGGFNAYMASMGKLGGQNKVPRLSNDRSIAEELEARLQEG